MTRHTLVIRLLLFSGIIPIVVAGVGVVIMLSWLPGLPAPVVVHWGVEGNSVGPAFSYPLAVAVVVVAVALLLSVVLASVVRPGQPSIYELTLAVIPVWLAFFITGSGITLLGAQRNGTAEIGHPWVGVLASLGIAAAASGGAWLLLPRPKPLAKPGHGLTPPAMAMRQGQRTAWIGRVAIRPAATVLTMLLVSLMFALGIALILGSRPFGWVIAPLAVVLAFGLSTFDIRVTVDRRGIVVRGALGVPNIVVALDDVARVGVVTVNGLVDTGGWGTRFTPGRRTVVMIRSGEAIEVVRRSGRTLVVTIDDSLPLPLSL
jgi:hypothetical protein